MRAGDLRHRVTIQTKSRVSDNQGGSVITPVTLTTVWGEVQALTGREAVAATAISATASYRIRIRARSDVTPTAQVTWSDHGVTRTFQVEAVINVDTTHREQHLFCSERAS